MSTWTEHRPVRSAAALAINLAAVAAAALIGALGVQGTTERYAELQQPSWAPPSWLFGPVWTVLYVLIAVSATLSFRDVGGPRRRLVLGLFAANLVLNLAWTWIFFQGHAPTAAGVEILFLLGTIVALIWLVRPYNRVAAMALVPYGAWVTFATALTWTIAASN